MVTETEAPTREQLETEAANKLAEVKAAEKLVTSAMKQFESSVGQVPMEQLLELGRAVDKAKTDAENAGKLAKRAQERVDGFELEAKRDERNALIAQDVITTRDAMINFDAYTAVGVEKLTLVIDMIERSVTPKASGPGIRTSTPRAKSENGSGGFKSAGAVIVQGQQYPSVTAAYNQLRAQADGANVLPDGAYKASNGVTARGWLDKHAGGFEYVEPQTA